MPFAVALFIGNTVSVILLTKLVLWTSARFAWWLNPSSPAGKARINALGTVVVVAAYAGMAAGFWWLF
ncbi:MAG: hypothetical protein ACYC1L_03255 [Alphaproteobacteria bacterium]